MDTLTITERTGLTMVDLRILPGDQAAHNAVEAALGAELAKFPRTSWAGDGFVSLWWSIDQWLLVSDSNALSSTLTQLQDLEADYVISTVDVSDARICYRLEGKNLRTVLAKSSSANLFSPDYQDRYVRRLAIGEQAAALHVIDAAAGVADLYCFRSYALYIKDWLTLAAHPDRALTQTLV